MPRSSAPATSGREVSTLEAANRDLAVSYYDSLLNEPEALDDALGHVHPAFRQHTPGAADDVDGIRQFIRTLQQERPGLHSEVKRVFVDGEFVILHNHVRWDADEAGEVSVDIYRVRDGQVLEHWDVLQDMPREASNANGMF